MSLKPTETLLSLIQGAVHLGTDNQVSIVDPKKLREETIDRLINGAVFAEPEQKALARWLIWELGWKLGIYPASIHDFYLAKGRGAIAERFTVPAINLRAMAYDSARAVFRAANPRKVGALIFEIARSEIGYTDQRPLEYVTSVMAAAVKEGYEGPLFVQGDHFQVSGKKFQDQPDEEVQAIEQLIRESIQAGFYNIDIDTSTLVDLSQPTIDQQQRVNCEQCAHFTAFIRKHQPADITISVGGEIGEVGGKNSDETELRAFMDGYLRALPAGLAGLSKISIQTGTSHGGVVLPDGTLAQVAIDFNVLKTLSEISRSSYGMGGTVQHGASTLPDEAFHQFVTHEAIEVHLATGFQNIIYDHEKFPAELRRRMYEYLKEKHANEWKSGKTEEQFLYSTRKKGLGPFKADLWNLPEDIRAALRAGLEEKFGFLFDQLQAGNTLELVKKYVPPVEVKKGLRDFGLRKGEEEDVSDLAD
jgi:fructose-bisphosphate aldolase, class II